MPKLSSPYSLANVPKTSLSGTRSQSRDARIVSAYTVNGTFCIGVSNSSISVYDIRPNPKLAWTFSIPPASIVESISGWENPEKKGTTSAVVFAGQERNKSFLNVVQHGDDSDSSSRISISGPVARIACITASDSSNNRVLAILASGAVETYDRALTKRVDANSDLVAGGPVVGVFDANDADRSLYVVVQNKALSIIGVDELDGSVHIVSTHSLETVTVEEMRDSPVLFNEGSLYTIVAQNNNNETYIRQIPILAQDQERLIELNLPNKEARITSLLALDAHKIVLTTDNNAIIMIDVRFESILSQISLDKQQYTSATLLCFSTEHSVALAYTKTKDSSDEVVGIPVDLGKGSLLESVGRGMRKEQATTNESELVVNEQGPLLTRQKGNSRLMQSGVFAESEKRKQELEQISTPSIDSLVSLLKKHHGNVDRRLVLYLCQKVFGLTKRGTSFKVQKGFQIAKSNMLAAEYLLQHALFPTTQTSGLLNLLVDYPKLFLIAITSTPGLSCESVVAALCHPSDDIFMSACQRLQKESSFPVITETIRESWSIERMRQCINRLIKNEQFDLITCFIDAGGLVRWTGEDVELIRNNIDSQVEQVESACEISSLLVEVFRQVNKQRRANALGSKNDLQQQSVPNEPYVIEANNSHRLVLALNKDESMLRSERYNASSTSELIQETLMMGQRVPVYSIEKLII